MTASSAKAAGGARLGQAGRGSGARGERDSAARERFPLYCVPITTLNPSRNVASL